MDIFKNVQFQKIYKRYFSKKNPLFFSFFFISINGNKLKYAILGGFSHTKFL